MNGKAHDNRRLRKPSFFWQGVFILLPVIILACIGTIFLQRDKNLVMEEARDQARSLAQQIASHIGSKLDTQLAAQALYAFRDVNQTNTTWRRSISTTASDNKIISTYRVPEQPYRELQQWMRRSRFQPHQFGTVVGTNGVLLKPVPYPDLPEPVETANDLRTARFEPLFSALGSNALDTAIGKYEEALKKGLADPMLSRARFQLAGLLEKEKRLTEAERFYAQVCNSDGQPATLSGLPLKPLSAVRLLRLRGEVLQQAREVTAEMRSNVKETVVLLGSNAVNEPSFLTPMLLKEALSLEKTYLSTTAEAEKWQSTWHFDEVSRAFYQQLMALEQFGPEGPATTNAFWGHWDDHDWLISVLAIYEGDAGEPDRLRGYDVHADSKTLIEIALLGILDESKLRLPRYASVSFELMGQRFPVEPARPKEFPYEVNGPWLDLGPAGYIDWYTRQRVEWNVHSVAILDQAKMPQFTNAVEVLGQAEEQWKVAGVFLGTNYTARPLNIPGLAVRIHLVDPEALFAMQQQRTWLLGSLIAFSAVSALIGLVTARRAFYRQARLNEMRSNFVSSVSHELRAPIASVRLMAEGLEQERIREPAKQKEYFRFIGQECRRLSSLIENVLDFSRIEQGRKQYEFEPTDVVKLVGDTVKLMEPYAGEKNVKLQLDVNADQFSALTDQPDMDGRAIQQALINLIDNATKHSAGGSEVTVSAAIIERPAESSPVASSEKWIAISVKDSGPGIPKAEQEKIFDQFYRLGSELRRETQGIGIGLSIVKHIVTAHSGRVVVASEVGQGSCFTIELPAQPGPH